MDSAAYPASAPSSTIQNRAPPLALASLVTPTWNSRCTSPTGNWMASPSAFSIASDSSARSAWMLSARPMRSTPHLPRIVLGCHSRMSPHSAMSSRYLASLGTLPGRLPRYRRYQPRGRPQLGSELSSWPSLNLRATWSEPHEGTVDGVEPAGHQQHQQKPGWLRARAILRAHIQGWRAIDLGPIAIGAGSGSWASFLEAATGDDLTAKTSRGWQTRCWRTRSRETT